MKKIILSVSTLAFVGVLILGATTAFFSDTEVSKGNTFIAGEVTLKINGVSHINKKGLALPGFNFNEEGLNFTLDDLKPLDNGKITYKLENGANEAHICVLVENATVSPKANDLALAEMLTFMYGTDTGLISSVAGVWQSLGTMAPNGTGDFLVDYCFGTYDGGNCILDPAVLAQTDGYNPAQLGQMVADLKFYAVQTRHNSGFKCSDAGIKTLLLENKDADWKVISDNTKGFLTYNTAGDKFDYTFQATGLTGGMSYSLIYYADFENRFNVWGGNNPGALIGTFTADVSGNIALTVGGIDLGIDLPATDDWNGSVAADYCASPDSYDTCRGAKIWLVPSSDYDSGQKKVINWNPSAFLFETDLINYNDTNK